MTRWTLTSQLLVEINSSMSYVAICQLGLPVALSTKVGCHKLKSRFPLSLKSCNVSLYSIIMSLFLPSSHSLTYSFIHAPSHSFIHSSNHVIHRSKHTFIHPSRQSFFHLVRHLCFHSCIHRSIHSFTQSFIHSSTFIHRLPFLSTIL